MVTSQHENNYSKSSPDEKEPRRGRSSATSGGSKERRKERPSEVHGTVRLTIEISSGPRKNFYVVVPHRDADRRLVATAWRLIKADGSNFDVALTEHGFQCDCEDFVYRQRLCKHIRGLQAAGLLPKDVK